ncbi:MAG: SsrA-binding protein SmpB [Candidatus Yonathbacteria bacterium]|nr:SsrA-binding protein SmpB [Candidatus Yonathbacteria bacterium]
MSLIRNKKAHFDYDILEKFEAGLDLHGFEVKSLRGGHGSLEGAHVIVRGGEAFVIGMTIPPYQTVNTPASYDPARNRRLLLSKKELFLLAEAESKKGLTIVPISVYNKSRYLKVEIAIVRGKKQFDKRETIKKREADLEMRRSLKDE